MTDPASPTAPSPQIGAKKDPARRRAQAARVKDAGPAREKIFRVQSLAVYVPRGALVRDRAIHTKPPRTSARRRSARGARPPLCPEPPVTPGAAARRHRL